MNYTKDTCENFVEVLASKSPTPGGGGASALVGAVGVALGNMVGSLTVGKKKYAEVEDEIKAMMETSTKLQNDLLELVQKEPAESVLTPQETPETRSTLSPEVPVGSSPSHPVATTQSASFPGFLFFPSALAPSTQGFQDHLPNTCFRVLNSS